MENNIKIETIIHLNKFKPREYQKPVIRAIATEGGTYKKLLIVMPRRAGKDVLCFNLLIRAAVRQVGSYFYCLPTFAQARSVIWDSITNTGQRFLDFIPKEIIAKIRNDTMTINLINGSIIKLIGSDSYDTSIVGSNPRMIVFSEYALADENAYKLAALPILRANDGIVCLISTPRGKNHMYELYQIAKNNPADWFTYFLTIDDTNHISPMDVKREIASGEISEDMAMQEYYCFPPDQEVLLHDRVLPIADIKIDDLVISHTGRPRKVLDTICREYDGDLIEISSWGSSDTIRCTPNHPIRTYCCKTQSYTWKPAEDITVDDRLVFPKMNYSDFSVLSLDMCKVIAWYITEGSCFKNAVQFSLGTLEEVNEVEDIIQNIGYMPDVRSVRTGAVVTVNSCNLADFLKSHCGTHARNKRIPFYLIMGWEREFFFELMKGDGCKNISKGHEKYSYTTISKTLAYQVQILANSIKKGYAAGISVRKAYKSIIEERPVNCSQSYQINISFSGPRDMWLIRGKNCIAAKIKEVKRVPYSGKVYNLNVQYDESYIVAGRAVHNCSFEMGQEGSYYAKYIDKMRIRGQIGIVPWEPYHKVHTSWDLGIKDPTCIIFFQVIGELVRIIDYYEESDRGMDHFARVIQDKPYMYGYHFPPHDIMARESARGLTKREMYKELGIKFTEPVHIDIEDGIELVRRTFTKLWIDEKNCSKLIKALENYREEFDVKRKVYKGRPLHDWSSHAADCARYMCASLPKTKDSLSAEKLDKIYREAMFGEIDNVPAIFRDESEF